MCGGTGWLEAAPVWTRADWSEAVLIPCVCAQCEVLATHIGSGASTRPRSGTTSASGRVLPFKEGRDQDDEKHMHPLQLDVIHRVLQLWSNPGERVLTPFMGVGSEVYEAVRTGRYGVGAELKPSYYRQAVKNLAAVDDVEQQSDSLFDEAPL